MKPESSGTLTAVCMLIPLVAVPYFAIRGTQDLPGLRPTPDQGDDIEFASTGDFALNTDAAHEPETHLGSATDDATPFPTDDATVMEPSESAGDDPFENAANPSGFGSIRVHTPGDEPAAPQFDELVPAPDDGAAPAPKFDWETGLTQLTSLGMRNYRVESGREGRVHYFSAFFADGRRTGVIHRFEGEGASPTAALQSVVEQVADWNPDAATALR